MPTDQPALFASAAEREELAREAAGFITEASGMLRAARAMVEEDDPRLADQLTVRRGAVLKLLGHYQRFKHGSIFNPVIQQGTTSSAIVARALKAECVLMGECFGAYCARWAYADLATDWAAYRRDMLDIAEQLLDHLRKERDAIEKLLALASFYQAPERRAPRPPSPVVAIAV